MTTSDTPRVWIGSLAAYNAGSLIGEWFDAVGAPTDSREWVDAMAERGVMPTWQPESVRERMAQVHEEIWVFDHENFHGLLDGECSPSEAASLAESLERVDDMERFEAWLTHVVGRGYYANGEDAVNAYEDECHLYEGESFQDAAYEYLEGTGAFSDLPQPWDDARWYLARLWMDHMADVTEIAHAGRYFIDVS